MSARAKGQGDLETIEWLGGTCGYEAKRCEAIPNFFPTGFAMQAEQLLRQDLRDVKTVAGSVAAEVGLRALRSSRSKDHCTKRSEQSHTGTAGNTGPRGCPDVRFNANAKGLACPAVVSA